MTYISFDHWMMCVDAQLELAVGANHDELPDQPYYDWWSNGLEPPEVAEIVAGELEYRE